MSEKDTPRPANIHEWADIELCSECRHRSTTWCSVHKKDVPDDFTCGSFGNSTSV